MQQCSNPHLARVLALRTNKVSWKEVAASGGVACRWHGVVDCRRCSALMSTDACSRDVDSVKYTARLKWTNELESAQGWIAQPAAGRGGAAGRNFKPRTDTRAWTDKWTNTQTRQSLYILATRAVTSSDGRTTSSVQIVYIHCAILTCMGGTVKGALKTASRQLYISARQYRMLKR